jgi:hypothetical protein
MEAMRNGHPVVSAQPASPAQSGSVENVRYEGVSHGMKFEGWLNNGQFTSVYPVNPLK